MAYNILIVEDATDLMDLLKSKLSKNGYQVKATISCEEGLEIFYEFLADVIILDVNVDGEDGRDVCKQIRTHADFQHIPVIMISANDSALLSYQEYGASDILKKPFRFAQLH